jgi:hypothetical protein
LIVLLSPPAIEDKVGELVWLSPIVNFSFPIFESEPIVKVVPSNVNPDSPVTVPSPSAVITLLLVSPEMLKAPAAP